MTPAAALLVEDEPLVAFVAAESLSALGFTVQVAGSGEAALAAVDRGMGVEPVAVIDVGLPDVQGDVLIRRLRARAPGLRFIVSSGADPEWLRGRLDASVALLPKPYGESSLRRVLTGLGYDLPA